MPSIIGFDAFRLRWWSKSSAKPLPPPSEDDSDRSCSPEKVERRTSFHISTPKNVRQPPHRARDVQKALPGIPATSTSKVFHDEVVNEKSSDHFLEQPVEATEKLVGLLR